MTFFNLKKLLYSSGFLCEKKRLFLRRFSKKILDRVIIVYKTMKQLNDHKTFPPLCINYKPPTYLNSLKTYRSTWIM